MSKSQVRKTAKEARERVRAAIECFRNTQVTPEERIEAGLFWLDGALIAITAVEHEAVTTIQVEERRLKRAAHVAECSPSEFWRYVLEEES